MHTQAKEDIVHPISLTRRIGLIASTTTVTVAVVAGAAQAAAVRCTVVHRNARARSFVVANRAGRLFAIHAATSPRIASDVTVWVRRLRDGTYAALVTHVVSAHRSARVRLHGVVSYVDRRNGTYTLSADGVSMLVRTRSGHAAAVADALPGVGTVVTATGTVNDLGDVSESAMQTDGTQSTGISLEGTVLAVDTTTGTISVSSTDNEQAAGAVVVDVPSTLNISLFAVGQEVTLQPGGTYLLVGSASDQGIQAANSQSSEQGDQAEARAPAPPAQRAARLTPLAVARPPRPTPRAVGRPHPTPRAAARRAARPRPTPSGRRGVDGVGHGGRLGRPDA